MFLACIDEFARSTCNARGQKRQGLFAYPKLLCDRFARYQITEKEISLYFYMI